MSTGEPTHILKATSQNKSYADIVNRIESERMSILKGMIVFDRSILGKNSFTT